MSHRASERLLPVISTLPPWNLETLWRMDWQRFQELVCLVLAQTGLISEILWVRPDGTTVLTVVKMGAPGAGESLLQCAGWMSIDVGAGDILAFYQAVLGQDAERGIYVTPGRFDRNALLLARQKKLELIDGAEFLNTLGRMGYDEQQTLLRLATSGSWDVPSCPVCGGKLALIEKRFPQGEASKALRDLTYKVSKNVGEQTFCRHLVIKAGASVLFLNGVEAETIRVAGRIMGNVVCRGKLAVAAGATVSGLVAARSIQLDPGGLLEAESRILNSTEIQPVRPQPLQTLWACAKARCHGTLPVRTLG